MSLHEFIEGEDAPKAEGLMIIDYSQIALSTIMATMSPKEPIDENIVRRIILNSLRFNVRKFKEEYPEVVIAIDARNYWRKDLAHYYKGNRKKSRDKSDWDFPVIFDAMNKVKEELITYFPYKVIDVHRCEADDVAGVLIKKYHGSYQRIMMISSDGDWAQMQRYKNVKQWSPIQKKYVKPKQGGPDNCLKFKIIKGDAKDGIANIKSPEDTIIVEGARQKPIKEDTALAWLKKEPEEFCDEQMLKRYRDNEALLDLERVPEEYSSQIIKQFDEYPVKGRMRIYSYLVKNSLTELMDKVSDF